MRNSVARVSSLVVLLGALFGFSGQVAHSSPLAQQDCPLTSNKGTLGSATLVSGRLHNCDHTHNYTFYGEAGQVARIRMEADSSLDAVIQLYDNGNRLVDQADSYYSGRTEELIKTLTYSGNYRIAAKRYENSSGNYRLSLILDQSNNASSKPNAPSNLQVRPAGANGSTELWLSWQDNSNNEDGFSIWRWAWNEQRREWAWLYIGFVYPGTTSYIERGLRPNTQYHYVVGAYNGAGANWSQWQSGSTSTMFYR